MATTTFYPSLDGRVFRTGAAQTWATIVAGAGTGNDYTTTNSNAALTQADTTSNTFKFLSRGIFLFDTSSIPDTDEISSATLSFYIGSKSTAVPVSVNVVSSSPASDSALANGDYSNLGSTKFSSAVTVSGITTGAYIDFSLNASGVANIDKTGISKFGLRLEEDIDGSAPTWSSNDLGGVNVQYSETTGISQDPKLVVVHAPAITFIPKVMMF